MRVREAVHDHIMKETKPRGSFVIATDTIHANVSIATIHADARTRFVLPNLSATIPMPI
jgi:hypothetical protein